MREPILPSTVALQKGGSTYSLHGKVWIVWLDCPVSTTGLTLDVVMPFALYGGAQAPLW